MRVGMVRNDLGRGLYIADIESRSQPPGGLVHAPHGQSRNIRKPTDAELLSAILTGMPQGVIGTDVAATVDTSTNADLRIRVHASSAYTLISVTAGLATAKTTIRNDLNAGFLAAGLPLVASVVGTNQLQISTFSPNDGVNAYLQIDTNVLSTLNDVVGFAAGGVILQGTQPTALLAAVKAAVYPTPTTINVSSAAIIGADPGYAFLSPTGQTALVQRVADLVAPSLIETGDVLLSFYGGIISKARVATYRPDGARAGKATGIALACVHNDGVTAY